MTIKKNDLIEWLKFNYRKLNHHQLVCTGTTGKLVEEAFKEKMSSDEKIRHKITLLKSGPLGGDQQLGAMIAEGKIDLLIFLWDPMQPQPHDVDVKALLRISVLYNIPTACNRSSADFMISSELFDKPYKPIKIDYSAYLNRKV